jgi:thiamine-phosphate diphosphorylase/hydroxymethylpyrimidine kinase/phosphomethylpyrimidine kinase
MADTMSNTERATRPSVLVFAGLDPSGGAGLAADITAISAMGAHALPVVTVLTVQDNDRVFRVQAVESALVRQQAMALTAKMPIAAVKIGIIGSVANAQVLADLIMQLRQSQPDLPVVLDPVLASGHGDALAQDDPLAIIAVLLPLASVILPNRPEAARLHTLARLEGEGAQDENGSISANHQADHQADHQGARQAAFLLQAGCAAVLLKGGHADGAQVENIWFDHHGQRSWHWPRLAGSFHGSGCTLAASLAAALALKLPDPAHRAQAYTQGALEEAYRVAPGQLMPVRVTRFQFSEAGANMQGLYLVTPDWDDTDKLLAVSEAALQAGICLLQYRHKTADAAQRLQQATALQSLCRRYAVPFIINDFVELAIGIDADGVHVGGTDASVAEVRAQLGAQKIVGASCYGSLELAEKSAASGASYLALGGFYPSLKKQYPVTTKPDIVAEVRSRWNLPLVVIGGMTPQNSAPLVALGADMVAAISSVYGDEASIDVAATKQAVQAFRALWQA